MWLLLCRSLVGRRLLGSTGIRLARRHLTVNLLFHLHLLRASTAGSQTTRLALGKAHHVRLLLLRLCYTGSSLWRTGLLSSASLSDLLFCGRVLSLRLCLSICLMTLGRACRTHAPVREDVVLLVG